MQEIGCNNHPNQHCSEQCCTVKATHFEQVELGLLTALVPFCEQHADQIDHSQYYLPEDNEPDAECRLEKRDDHYVWVIDECPYCLQQHEHGGGKVSDDPRKHLGHRLAHCHDPFRQYASEHNGYILVEQVEENVENEAA